MDQQVVDKFISMLQQAAAGLGMAVGYAWPTLVRYTWAQATVTMVGWLTMLTLFLVVSVGLTAWLIKIFPSLNGDQIRYSADQEFQQGATIVSLLCIWFGYVLLVIIGLCNIFYWGPIMLAPEGATLIRLIEAATKTK